MALEPFVLRVVVDALTAGEVVGEVQHVATGRSAAVRNVDELVAFLRRHADEPDLIAGH